MPNNLKIVLVNSRCKSFGLVSFHQGMENVHWWCILLSMYRLAWVGFSKRVFATWKVRVLNANSA